MADLRMWSKELIIDLILLYKSFPCLWKIKSNEYKNKNLKDEAYQQIVVFCKDKGFPEANRDFVVKKLQSLRGSFRKELKKVVDSHRSGGDVYKSSLWYFEYLLFTKEQEIDEDSDCVSVSDDIFNSTYEESMTDVTETEKQTKAAETGSSAATFTSKRNKRKASFNYQATSNQAASEVCIDTLKSATQELSEFDIAGMNVAKKLSRMDPLQAIYAESIINNVLRTGLLNKLTDDTGICDNYCNRRLQTPSLVHSLDPVSIKAEWRQEETRNEEL